jgi:hypothetical protein
MCGKGGLSCVDTAPFLKDRCERRFILEIGRVALWVGGAWTILLPFFFAGIASSSRVSLNPSPPRFGERYRCGDPSRHLITLRLSTFGMEGVLNNVRATELILDIDSKGIIVCFFICSFFFAHLRSIDEISYPHFWEWLC